MVRDGSSPLRRTVTDEWDEPTREVVFSPLGAHVQACRPKCSGCGVALQMDDRNGARYCQDEECSMLGVIQE